MSAEHLVNFNDLLSLTFDNGSVHIKNLQTLFKILFTHLKLEDVRVSLGDQNLMLTACDVQILKESDNVVVVKKMDQKDVKTDPVVATIPKSDKLVENLCKSKHENPIVEMLDLLNITKRVEAVEISILKLISLVENLMKKDNDKKIKEADETENASKNESENLSKNSSISKIETPSINSVISTSSKELLTPTKKDSTPTNSPRDSQGSPSLKSSTPSATNTQNSQASQEAVDSSPPKCCQPTIDIEGIVKQQIDSASEIFCEKISKLSKEMCEIQKSMTTIQENVDDLIFACEQNDVKSNETAWEIKDFNSKIFCLKSDVKTLLSDAKNFKEKFIEVDAKCETLNTNKTNKFYVDELWNQKAFKSDLELFVPRDEFDPLTDILRLKFSLLSENFEKLQENTKKSLACFKSRIDEKLEKQELEKFKDTTTTLFDEFVTELKILLHQLTKNPLGIAGTKNLDPNLNCFSCESKISMMKTTVTVPKLDAISQKFKYKLDKIPVEKVSNENFRQIFCKETKSLKSETVNNVSSYRTTKQFSEQIR